MTGSHRKSLSESAASRRVVRLLAQVKDLREQLEVEREFHEAYLDSQRELEASHERYSNLYNLAPVGYLTLDGAGLIHEINLTGARMLGKARSAVLGVSLGMFVAKANQRAFLRHLGLLRRGESEVATELTLISKDHAPRVFELRAVRVKEETGTVRGHLYYSAMTDITVRKDAEEALRASEEKYRSLFMNMNEEVYLWRLIRDKEGRIKTWRLVDLNPAGLRGWGKTRSEAIGKTADEIFPGTTAHFMPIVQKIIAEDEPYSYETYFPPLKKHLRYTSIPMGEDFITAGTDISDLKKAEKILKESKANLEKRVAEQTAEIRHGYDTARAERQRLFDVLETLPVMIGLLTQDFRVAFANRSFRERFGEARDKHCHEYCFGLKEPCSFCNSHNVIGTGRAHHWEVTAPDGSVFDVYDFPFIDTNGAAMILEMSIDISVRRQAEEELATANQNLEDRAMQLRALATELTMAEQHERKRLAMVLHDGLQQMLVAARFKSMLIERGRETEQKAGELSNILNDCIETSRTLTAELSPPVLHHGGLVPALKWLSGWVLDKHGLSVKVTSRAQLRRPPEEIEILLFQSVRELLFNVIKHSGINNATIRVGLTQQGRQIHIQVADEGAGFEIKRGMSLGNTSGIRMGLFGIRERLGYFGGSLKIDTAPGRGARVTLIAPLKSRKGEPPDDLLAQKQSAAFAMQPESKEDNKHKIRVVLVDDHLVMRQGLANLLNIEPDIVIVGEASDGKSAIDIIRNTKPEVVLMDINMPGMDGVEATRRIREEMPEVKIIGLSLVQERERSDAIIAAGAYKYLAKTGPSEAVIQAIRACVHVADRAIVH